MKKYLIVILIAFFSISVKAQIQFQIDEIHYKLDSIQNWKKLDTILIKNSNKFRLILDKSALNDSPTLRKITLLKKFEVSKEIANLDNEKFKFGEDEIQILVIKVFVITNKPIATANRNNAANIPIEKDTISKEFRLVIYRAKEKVEKTVDEKIKEAVEERLSGLFNEKTDTKKVLMFTLNSKKILPQFTNPKESAKNKDLKDSLFIDSVSITFLNGKISRGGMYVKLSNGDYYRNQKRSFSVSKKKYDKYLFIDNSIDEKGIKLMEAIDFTYFQRFNYPDNTTLTLTRKRDTAYVENKTTISNLLNIAIYSDLLSLIGRKANGIIQTELDANFITNTRTWTKFDFTPFSFINPYFSLAKFDSKFQQIDSSKLGKNNKDSIDRLYINQTAYLRAGLRFNIFKISLWPNQEIQINGGAELVLTNADSIFKKDIVTINYYPEIIYRVHRMDNFGLEAAARWLIQVPSKNIEFFNSKPVVFFNPQVTLYYYPFSDPNKKIYLRYNHFAEIGAGKSNYPQIQFGYKTNLFKKD
jgi:hypothetical protein